VRQSDSTINWSDQKDFLDYRLEDNNDKSGSELSRGMRTKARQQGTEWRIFHELQPRGVQQARTPKAPTLPCANAQNSESGGGLEEQSTDLGSSVAAARDDQIGPGLSTMVDATHFEEPSFGGNTLVGKPADNKDKGFGEIEDERIKENGIMDTEMLKTMDKWANATINVDDHSLRDGGSKTPAPTSGHQQDTRPFLADEPGLTFDVIFSNLFSNTTLKVADRVEIHEPCRPIVLLGNGNSGGLGGCVWIVERYVVNWQKISF